MYTITGEYIKSKLFSKKITIRDEKGIDHEVKATRYIIETLSCAFLKGKVVSFAIDDKGKAFYMLPQSSTYLIKSELENNLKSKKNKELISSGITSIFMASIGSLMFFSGIIGSIVASSQSGHLVLNSFFACSLISLPAFYMSIKTLDKYFNFKKILKHNYLLSKMTNHLNNYNTITLDNKVNLKESVKQ